MLLLPFDCKSYYSSELHTLLGPLVQFEEARWAHEEAARRFSSSPTGPYRIESVNLIVKVFFFLLESSLTAP